MANELGQPTSQEIAEKFCTEMLCNALLCDGCPVQAILHATQHNAHLTPESLATSQAVVNASASEPSDSVPQSAQAQVV